MSRIKGSKNGSFYRGIATGQIFKNPDIKKATCVMLVSVQGNVHCTDDDQPYFSSCVIELLEKFNKVIVLIVDEPQQYNLKADHPEASSEALRNMAIELGNQWWERHEASLLMCAFQENDPYQPLTIGEQTIGATSKKPQKKIVLTHSDHYQDKRKQFRSASILTGGTTDERIEQFNDIASHKGIEVQRWQEWVNKIPQDEIEKARNLCTLEQSPLFLAIDESANEFARRQKNPLLSYQCSVDFLREEAPLLALGAIANDALCMAYPADEIKALSVAKEAFVIHKGLNYMNWVQFTFYRTDKEQVVIKPLSIIQETNSQIKKTPIPITLELDHDNGNKYQLSRSNLTLFQQKSNKLTQDEPILNNLLQNFLGTFHQLEKVLPKEDMITMLALLHNSLQEKKTNDNDICTILSSEKFVQ